MPKVKLIAAAESRVSFSPLLKSKSPWPELLSQPSLSGALGHWSRAALDLKLECPSRAVGTEVVLTQGFLLSLCIILGAALGMFTPECLGMDWQHCPHRFLVFLENVSLFL